MKSHAPIQAIPSSTNRSPDPIANANPAGQGFPPTDRSAGFQPAVSPTFSRPGVRTTRRPQTGSLRYGRLQVCATTPDRFATFFPLAILVTLLAGCSPSNLADRVEIVADSSFPTPAMTFEVRFESAMVHAAEVGVALTNSPLVINPPLAGTFTWLSSRSGVFTPTEPLTLGTRYELTLRPQLTRADGQPSGAALRWSFTTPPFGLVATSPTGPDPNASTDPEIKLLFNADLRAKDAEPFICFRNASGQRIPADVQQATDADRTYDLDVAGSTRTWRQEFMAARNPDAGSGRDCSPTNPVANLLVVTPRQPLSIGKDWELIIASGLPAIDASLRSRERKAVPVGDVTPFVVNRAWATNLIDSGAILRFWFSKAIPGSLTNAPFDWLELHPRPTNLAVQVNGCVLELSGAFQGGMDYAVRLPSKFVAIEPFGLTGTNSFDFTMPHLPPRLYFPAFSRDQLASGNRTFPLLAVNVPKVLVRARLLDPQTAIHALRGYRSYFNEWNERRDPDEWLQRINFNLVPGRTVFYKTFEPGKDVGPDTATTLNLEWDQILNDGRTGIVFLDARRLTDDDAKPLGTQALIQLTDLGLLWKKSRDAFEVFAFSQSTGQPASGATAALYSDDNELLQEAATDTNGMARLPAHSKAGWVAIRSGEDFHAVELDDYRLRLYAWNVPHSGWRKEENPRRVMFISDRNVYRPGEELHLAAFVRDWTERGLVVPAGLTGTLQCTDSRGRCFLRTNATLNANGSWSLIVPLPDNPRGAYSANLRFSTNEPGTTFEFSVEEFQPNAFEIALSAKSEFAVGKDIQVPVSAHYLFGQPLSRARIKWSILAMDADFCPPHFQCFTFNRTDFESRLGRGRSSVSLSGQGSLTGSSGFIIAPEIPINPVAPQPRSASLLVEVTDLNQQTLSRQTGFIRHSSEFYLGLRSASGQLSEGKSPTLEAVAVRSDGQPWPKPVKAQLSLQRFDWESVRIQGAGRTARYHSEAVFTNVLQKEVLIAPIALPAGDDDQVKGVRLDGLPPLPAGQYVLELKSEDPAGRSVISSLIFTVSGPAALAWNYRNETQLALKPDRKSYAPGDTAEILVESPFSGLALVTVEREKVLRSFVARLEGNAPSIRVPLEPTDVPNVFVSVALIRGADDSPHEFREPESRIGYCQLPVLDPKTRLAVKVIPATTNCLPAQPVDVSAEVTDADGRAVPGAEVLLYAVDDGILGLTGYAVPDPHGFFYAPRLLDVESGISLPNLLAEDPDELRFENKGFPGGGGGKEGLRVRKNFLACAFWSAALTTDVKGRITARFLAPDSLTRYRLFAVAGTDRRFGSGQAAFEVSKPLTIDPALPRIANITDRLLARAVIHNQTASAGEVLVSLELDDKAVAKDCDGIPTRRVSVPANGSASVEFPVEFTDTGEARWIWKARFTDPANVNFTDAVQSTLDVGHIAPVLREVLLTRVAGSATNLLAGANPQLLAGRGTVTISLANTRVAELVESASHLLHYPYGCAEQTSSSLLPWIVLRDSACHLQLRCRGTNDMNAAIRAGVARLFSMQTSSGGLGYWPRATEPMLWASAYGGMVLALAQRHGIEVPEKEFDSLLKFLSNQLRSADTDASELSDCCLALYALALANAAEPAYHEKLFSRRGKLSAENRALLALAIAESRGPSKMIGELLRPDSAPRRKDDHSFSCNARVVAIRLLAWTRYQPDDPVVDRLVDDLMREQKEAHWGTTQGNAWALLALADYAARVEGTRPPAEGALKWGSQSIPFRLLSRTNVFTLNLPFTNADPNLVLTVAAGQRVYTSITIEARPAETPQPRQDRGFSLQRRYDRLDDDNALQDIRDARVGDRVLVTLNLTVRTPASYVVIDDALPSILEAINPEFKTQAARSGGMLADDGEWWPAGFREIRKDRCLSFADRVPPGNYTLRYLARVRAAGTVTAPSAKVEEMYHPDRYGLTETQVLTSRPME